MKEYLDFNATTPVTKDTADLMSEFLIHEYGNAGSRSHNTGSRAKKAVLNARQQIASICNADISEVTFTSGATESNNIALLGMLEYAKENNKNHIISTAIEHKAVLDPLLHMEKLGFKVSFVRPTKSGHITPEAIMQEITDQTFLVSCMHANNETGVINDIDEISNRIKELDSKIYFHSDCAQTFAKTSLDLSNPNIDMISFSSHKFFGPKGIGGLIARKNAGVSIPLRPIMFGGGQERGLRPGTLPVHLIVGMGDAAEKSTESKDQWMQDCLKIKLKALEELNDPNFIIYGTTDHSTLPNTLSISFNSHAEAVIIALKEVAEIATGSACTSESYSPSHVLTAMGLDEEAAKKVVRLSWSSNTDLTVFSKINDAIKILN